MPPRAESLRDTFARLGADEPEEWARSQVKENIAQLGRLVFLRAVWREIERWRGPEGVAGLAEGASDEAIELAAQAAARAALDVASGSVQLIDNEEDIESTEPLPGWLVIECEADGKPSGRVSRSAPLLQDRAVVACDNATFVSGDPHDGVPTSAFE
jgi:hypothetical protein